MFIFIVARLQLFSLFLRLCCSLGECGCCYLDFFCSQNSQPNISISAQNFNCMFNTTTSSTSSNQHILFDFVWFDVKFLLFVVFRSQPSTCCHYYHYYCYYSSQRKPTVIILVRRSLGVCVCVLFSRPVLWVCVCVYTSICANMLSISCISYKPTTTPTTIYLYAYFNVMSLMHVLLWYVE